jgi:hypothetical protein
MRAGSMCSQVKAAFFSFGRLEVNSSGRASFVYWTTMEKRMGLRRLMACIICTCLVNVQLGYSASDSTGIQSVELRAGGNLWTSAGFETGFFLFSDLDANSKLGLGFMFVSKVIDTKIADRNLHSDYIYQLSLPIEYRILGAIGSKASYFTAGLSYDLFLAGTHSNGGELEGRQYGSETRARIGGGLPVSNAVTFILLFSYPLAGGFVEGTNASEFRVPPMIHTYITIAI